VLRCGPCTIRFAERGQKPGHRVCTVSTGGILRRAALFLLRFGLLQVRQVVLELGQRSFQRGDLGLLRRSFAGGGTEFLWAGEVAAA
jgi:hypothetical protein